MHRMIPAPRPGDVKMLFNLNPRRLLNCLFTVLGLMAALAVSAPLRAEGAGQQLSQAYFVQQTASEDLLITINAFEAELESKVKGPNDEILLRSGITGSRIVPVFQYIYAPKTNRQLDIEVTSSEHTGRTEFGIELTRLKPWDSRSSSVSQAYRLLSFGTEMDAAESQANWTVKIDSLTNAGRLFQQYGMQEMRLWANYLAAHLVYFQLHDHSIAYGMTNEILAELKGTRLQKIELATLQLQVLALTGLRKSGSLNVSAGAPDPLQAELARTAELARSMGYDYEQARALYASGVEFAERSANPDALRQFQQAGQIADTIGSTEMAKAIRESTVQVHTVMGDAPATSEVLQEIESQLVEEGGGDDLALNLLAQARLLINTYRYERALEVLAGALNSENNSAIRKQINFELAKILYETGHMDEALSYLRLAEISPDAGRKMRGRPLIDIGEGLRMMANIQRYKGEFESMRAARSAQAQFQPAADHYLYAQALDAAARNGGNRQLAASLFRQGFDAANAAGHADLKHLAHLQYCALADGGDGACVKTSLTTAYEWLLAAGVPRFSTEAMFVWAQLLVREGRRSEALVVMDRLIGEIHMLRSALPDVLGAWYWERREQVFTGWLEMLVSDSRQRGNADGSAALLALSKMRHIDGQAQPAAGASGGADTTEPLRTLLAQRAAPDAGQSVFTLNGRINTGLEALRPGPGQSLEFPTDDGLKKFLRALGHDETVLTFHLGPDMALVWVGKKDGVRRVDLANPAELYRQVQATRQDLTNPGLGAFNKKMDELGRLLLGPVSSLLSDTVYCIPAGPLLGFPLDALRLNGHYLVERYNFVNLLSFPGNPNPSGRLQLVSAQTMFLAGNPRDYAGDYATRLETSREISAVADLFVGPGLQIIQGVALLPDEFQGGSFKRSNLVHLAMPGIINLKYPDESGLELSESEFEPGRVIMMAPDIRAQGLGAGLVFLSSTRLSENPRSGFSNRPGLVADFMTAGAGSVIVNLQSGDTESDVSFITDFYRALKDSGNIAGSLRKARLQYLERSRDNGLYDWTGFQLYIR